MNYETLLENIVKLEKIPSIVDVDGTTVNLEKELGAGGSKTVYQIELDNQKYALALPNLIDHPMIRLRKWYNAMSEPENTNQFRNAGLITNDISEIIVTTINGISIPAILMKSYDEHDFDIYDAKNHNKSHKFLLPYIIPTNEELEELFIPGLNDVLTLVENGINIDSDSFNLCNKGKVPRLYFNDLGNAEFNSIDDTTIAINYYKKQFLRTFVSTLNDNSYRNNQLAKTISESY
ncbi:hypothetical protein JXM83_02315 [Candidatus Woesearchaeota archaeon]|nr:hypothetical protein [Candidatus Woesearchaeota archaeon]